MTVIRARIAEEGERVLAAQRPVIEQLDSWEAWQAWRDLVVTHFRRPERVAAFTGALAGGDLETRRQIEGFFQQWQGHLERGLRSLQEQGELRPEADPAELAQATLASLQGGLVLSHAANSLRPLEVALDAALAYLGSWSTGRPVGA